MFKKVTSINNALLIVYKKLVSLSWHCDKLNGKINLAVDKASEILIINLQNSFNTKMLIIMKDNIKYYFITHFYNNK